jgi:hypothetical protein
MPPAPGIVTSGTGPPNAVVEIQPGMNVQPVVLVDQNGQYVTTSGSTATAGYLADLTGSVAVFAAPAPTAGQVLTATSGSTATWQSGSTETAGYLATTGASVYVAGGSAPSTGQELIATSGTTATWQFGASGVLTTLGDMLFENSTPALARLAGNTSATKMFLTQTGNGTVSAAPAWGTVTSSDLPTAGTAAQGAVLLPIAATSLLVGEEPGDRGLIAWTFPPWDITTESACTGELPSGDVGLTKVYVRQAQTITNIVLAIGNQIGGSLTTGQNYVGLYNSSGGSVAASADQSTAWANTGNKNTSLVIPLNTPYAAAAGWYWIAYLCNESGGTGPTFCYAIGSNSSQVNFALGTANAYSGYLAGPNSVLPASFTPSSAIHVGHSACFPFLAGLS